MTATVAGPTMAVPDDATMIGLVEAQVDRTPDRPALIHRSGTLTYAQLDARANRLAHELVDAGVGPEATVGLHAGRSVELAVGLLGILKAGGACLPLDPSYPAARLAHMLDDARPVVVLATAGLTDSAALAGRKVRTLTADAAGATRPGRLPGRAGPDHLAYVLYTSGSTGQPKGVELAHRGLVNHNVAVARAYGLDPADRVVQFCSISFDVHVEEIFPTWQTGGAVVLRPDDVAILGPAWLAWLRRRSVTVLNLPTAYWHEWVRDLHRSGARIPERIRLVVVGGERARGAALRTWQQVGGDRVRWINAYGPAEASVLATLYEPGPDPWGQGDPPIGRPLANTYVRILDDDGRPVAHGDAGDLHIGGVGLARGYRNQPKVTARRFVADPDGGRARLYRTGDMVRQRADGDLEFVGRRDDQVKVRGFRIECGEVEAALARHPAVAEAVVVAREDRPGDRRLVAYVVAANGDIPTAARLRRFLADRLPPFMLPSAVVTMDVLPTTGNGKVDRSALPAPVDPRGGRSAAASVAGRTATETAVAAAFARVLGVGQVGPDDDFFDLGGHSLLAAQVVAALGQRFGRSLGIGALLQAPTVAGLASVLDDHHRNDHEHNGFHHGGGEVPPPLTSHPHQPGERVPLTLSQEQMWQLETTADPQGLFNITALHTFTGPVDTGPVNAALARVVARHEPLRTRFAVDAHGPHQVPADAVTADLEVVDLSQADDPATQLRDGLSAQDAAPFDLAVPPLLRARLYRLADGSSVLATTFDHLVCDGASAYIYLSELAAAHQALAAGHEPALRPLAVAYSDFARWQGGWFTRPRLQRQVDYWVRRLAGMPRGPTVPLDRIPDDPTRRIVQRTVEVPPGLYRRVRELARAHQATLFVVTVAAMQAVFARAGGQTDVVLSTTVSGRQRAELEGLIGCFHGVGRIRTDLSGDPTFAAVVARTRRSVLGLFEHQDVPFMRVRRAVLPDLPAGGPALLAAVPIELQYFHTAHDEWAPGRGVVERPGGQASPDRLYFRGHLHPLHVTFLDDGTRLRGEFSYKTDFYDHDTIARLADGLAAVLGAVVADPHVVLTALPVPPKSSGAA